MKYNEEREYTPPWNMFYGQKNYPEPFSVNLDKEMMFEIRYVKLENLR